MSRKRTSNRIPKLKRPRSAKPVPGFDNVAFEDEGRRIVGTVTGYDHDGLLIVLNPFLDNIWHVPVDKATITKEHITGAPDCE